MHIIRRFTNIVVYMLVLFSFILGFKSDTVYASSNIEKINDNVIIVIDPGHGGENEGTTENGFVEKEMTLLTATAMYEELSKYNNITVYMTRTDDTDLSLKQRAEIAKSVNADFIFSIHYNASVNHNLFGAEVWIPAFAPYNSLCYEFAYKELEELQNYGLFIRGIKTKLNDKGTDYYGIIRQSVALNIPAVIIEHCHVDEARDNVYCLEDSQLIQFGISDATAVAKYFGLKSNELNVDYSEEKTYLNNKNNETILHTQADKTPPTKVNASISTCDYNTGEVVIDVEAYDDESPIMYYDYSINGGKDYSKLFPWPGANILEQTNDLLLQLDYKFESGEKPSIIVRAYNEFDAFTESNIIEFEHKFDYGDIEEQTTVSNDDIIVVDVNSNNINSKEDNKFLLFMLLILLIVIIMLSTYIFVQIISYKRRSKRRKNKRK